MLKKWIHLRGLQMNCPEIAIEGLSDYEAVLWLKEAIEFLRKRSNTHFGEYDERGCE